MPLLLRHTPPVISKGPKSPLLRKAPSFEENLEAIVPSPSITNQQPPPPTICISTNTPTASPPQTSSSSSSGSNKTGKIPRESYNDIRPADLPPSREETPSPRPTLFSTSLATADTNYFLSNATCTISSPPIVDQRIKSGGPVISSDGISCTSGRAEVHANLLSNSDPPQKKEDENLQVGKTTTLCQKINTSSSPSSSLNNYVVVDAITLAASKSSGGVTVKDLSIGESSNLGNSTRMTNISMTMNPSRAAKLAKILSVVEESGGGGGNGSGDSPTLERKYEIVTNQV